MVAMPILHAVHGNTWVGKRWGQERKIKRVHRGCSVIDVLHRSARVKDLSGNQGFSSNSESLHNLTRAPVRVRSARPWVDWLPVDVHEPSHLMSVFDHSSKHLIAYSSVAHCPLSLTHSLSHLYASQVLGLGLIGCHMMAAF